MGKPRLAKGLLSYLAENIEVMADRKGYYVYSIVLVFRIYMTGELKFDGIYVTYLNSYPISSLKYMSSKYNCSIM